MKADWYENDYPEDQDDVKKDKKQPRFWMPPEGDEKEVRFISKKPFTIYEHNIQLNGSYQNWFTCIRDIPGSTGCPLCERARRLYDREKENDAPNSIKNKGARYQVGMYTVVDTKGFTANDGTEVKNLKRLLPAKKNHLNMFKVHAERRDLDGSRYLVTRSAEKTSAGIGDNWEYQDRVDNVNESLPEDYDTNELDYKTLLAPKSHDELQAIVAQLDGGIVEEEAEASAGASDVEVDYGK